jgi:hypothetical protein
LDRWNSTHEIGRAYALNISIHKRKRKGEEMKANTGLMSVLTATFLFVAPMFVSSAPKEKASSDKSVQGTVLAATDVNLIIRKGKSDMSLEYDSASKKPSTLATGTAVVVHFRDEKNKHDVTTVDVVDGNSGAGKPQAK